MMRRPKVSVLATAIISSALMMWGGCGDKKKSKDQPETSKAAPAAVEGLQAIPNTASAVIGIDVAKLASSPLVHRGLERMFARDAELEAELKGVLKACQIDPLTDIKAATIALVPGADGSDSLLVTKGKYSEAAITACLGRFLADSGGRLESSAHEDRMLYHQVGKDSDGVWLAFGSGDTLLVASSKAVLVQSLGKGPKFGASGSELARYLPRVQSEQSLWAVGRLEPAVAEGLVQATGGSVEPPLAMLGSVDLAEGLGIRIELEMRSEDDANMLVSQAKLQIHAAALVLQVGGVGRLIQKIEFSTDKSWVRLDWRLNEQELADLIGSNLSGLSSTIDKEGGNVENPPLESEEAEIEGKKEHGNRNPDAGS